VTAELLVLPPVECAPRVEFERLRQLALSAVGHPGGRPWRLDPVDGGVQILADGQGESLRSDVGSRTIRLTAGAALATMRLGIAALGRRPVVSVMPETTRRTVLAVLRHGAQAEPTPTERALAAMIGPVGRLLGPVSDLPAPAGLLLHARAAVEAEGLWLRTVDQDARARLAAVAPGIAHLPAAARLMAIGGNHDVPVEHLRAGGALQNLVLTARLLGGAVVPMGWPADLACWHQTRVLRPCAGSCPHVLVAVSGAAARGWDG
jgi:hypothetical protein